MRALGPCRVPWLDAAGLTLLACCWCRDARPQFCWSGDHTLEATQQAIAEAAAAPGDEEQFVFVVSDANLQRYGIPPKALGASLLAPPSRLAMLFRVHAPPL